MGEALRNVSSYGRDLEDVEHMQKQRCLRTPLYVAKSIGRLGEVNDWRTTFLCRKIWMENASILRWSLCSGHA